MNNPIFVPLDVPTLDQAKALAEQIGDAAGAFKIGLELFTAYGPAALAGFNTEQTFLDLKLHDIPNTVAAALRSLQTVNPGFVTVHTTGGRRMLEAANENKGSIKTLGVTILTSLSDDDLAEVGLPKSADAVPALARLAAETGCDGIVCAPTDVAAVRAVIPKKTLIITPGVRPVGSSKDDQSRTLTPAEAMKAGANYLVIGRPITRASDPRAAALAILEELQ
jgi:orotidine-5'-phosphate decarboxylase